LCYYKASTYTNVFSNVAAATSRCSMRTSSVVSGWVRCWRCWRQRRTRLRNVYRPWVKSSSSSSATSSSSSAAAASSSPASPSDRSPLQHQYSRVSYSVLYHTAPYRSMSFQFVIVWRGGVVVLSPDSRSTGRRFDSRPRSDPGQVVHIHMPSASEVTTTSQYINSINSI